MIDKAWFINKTLLNKNLFLRIVSKPKPFPFSPSIIFSLSLGNTYWNSKRDSKKKKLFLGTVFQTKPCYNILKQDLFHKPLMIINVQKMFLRTEFQTKFLRTVSKNQFSFSIFKKSKTVEGCFYSQHKFPKNSFPVEISPSILLSLLLYLSPEIVNWDTCS